MIRDAGHEMYTKSWVFLILTYIMGLTVCSGLHGYSHEYVFGRVVAGLSDKH